MQVNQGNGCGACQLHHHICMYDVTVVSDLNYWRILTTPELVDSALPSDVERTSFKCPEMKEKGCPCSSWGSLFKVLLYEVDLCYFRSSEQTGVHRKCSVLLPLKEKQIPNFSTGFMESFSCPQCLMLLSSREQALFLRRDTF